MMAGAGSRLDQVLGEQRLTVSRLGDRRWRLSMPWRTLVYGVIGRDVDEELTLVLAQGPTGEELVLSCEAIEIHKAHGAGAAGVLAVAALTWILGGWTGGAAASLTHRPRVSVS